MVQKVAVSHEFEARHAATGKLFLSTQQKMGTFLAHLSHRLRVSYCHWPMSVVHRPSSNISSETARPRALIFGM